MLSSITSNLSPIYPFDLAPAFINVFSTSLKGHVVNFRSFTSTSVSMPCRLLPCLMYYVFVFAVNVLTFSLLTGGCLEVLGAF